MNIDFYINFEKRKNSTKRPVETTLVTKHTLTGYLKEPCSVMTPVIDIQNIPVQNNPCVMTYAYIPLFYRYYFVKDWTWVNGLWQVSLEVDVLATYKTHIGASTAYIERCAGNADPSDNRPYRDLAIIDRLYPATTDFYTSQVNVPVTWNSANVSDGCFVLGVFGGGASNSGTAVDYWAMTQSQMTSFMNYLLSDAFFNNIGLDPNTDPISPTLAKGLINPVQYIASCMWFPASTSTVGGSSTATRIKIGPYNTDANAPYGYRIGGVAKFHYNYFVTMPYHPDASARGTYLNYTPFTRYTLILPPFGTIPIDPAYFEVLDRLNINVCVDVVTGRARLYLSSYDSSETTLKFKFFETSTQFGVSIQIAQVANDMIKGFTSTINAVTGNLASALSFSGGNYGSSIAGTGGWMGSIFNAIEAFFPQLISQGINGSFAAFDGNPVLYARFAKVVSQNISEWGWPLCADRRIDTLSGYVKCGDAHLEITAFDYERKTAENYMLSGFFYE